MLSRPDNLASRGFNPLWWHLWARSVTAHAAALVGGGVGLWGVTWALGAGGDFWGALKVVWPAATALALADLIGALARDGTALAASLMGWSRRWVMSALLIPALCVALLGAKVNAGADHGGFSPQSPSLPNCAQVRAQYPGADALHSRCASLVAATEQRPLMPRATLRALPWGALEHHKSERFRRIAEPFLGILLGLAGVWLSKRSQPAPHRARVLAITLVTLALAHALWTLLLVAASALD